MFVNARRRAVLREQGFRRLFPHARNAGDIVGGVPHQRFEFDDLRGFDPRFFFEIFRGEHFEIADALFREVNFGGVVHELEGIPVARDDGGGDFFLLRHRADDVVRLQPLLFENIDLHCGEHFFQKGDLRAQIVRHRLSRALVFGVHLMAERGSVHVERHREMGGRDVLDRLEKHI